MTTTPAQRIGGWLLGPLARLLVALLSASLALLLYVTALATPQTFKTLGEQKYGKFAVMGRLLYYRDRHVVLHTVADNCVFKRRACVPKHYILWLLISVLLAIKAFAFSPSQTLLPCANCCSHYWPQHCWCPHFKRSQRVKSTFVNP